MKRSARRQKMYVFTLYHRYCTIQYLWLYACCFDLANRSMADSEVRISKASYATKALGYSEL